MESSPKGKNFDRRMTGASVIDEALHEVMEATLNYSHELLESHCEQSFTDNKKVEHEDLTCYTSCQI